MNTPIRLVAALSVLGACVAPTGVDTVSHDLSTTVATYIGTSNDWMDGRNWSTGRVPGPSDDVILDGDDEVVIDGATAGSFVQVRDLVLRDAATLEVRGTILQTRRELLRDDARLIGRGAGFLGDLTDVDDECSECSVVLNPTAKSKRIVDLQSSARVDVGLGGTLPAAIRHRDVGTPTLSAGVGTYATLTAETVELAGELDISLYYGFAPRPGDSFQVVTAGRLVGTFADLPEGAIAACNDELVCVRISYRAGDGNDVTLTAEQHRVAPASAKRMRQAPVVATTLVH